MGFSEVNQPLMGHPQWSGLSIQLSRPEQMKLTVWMCFSKLLHRQTDHDCRATEVRTTSASPLRDINNIGASFSPIPEHKEPQKALGHQCSNSSLLGERDEQKSLRGFSVYFKCTFFFADLCLYVHLFHFKSIPSKVHGVYKNLS